MERAVGLIFILSPPFTVVPTRSETSEAVTDVINGTPRLPGAAIHIIQTSCLSQGKKIFRLYGRICKKSGLFQHYPAA